jgi:hypothetical protein
MGELNRGRSRVFPPVRARSQPLRCRFESLEGVPPRRPKCYAIHCDAAGVIATARYELTPSGRGPVGTQPYAYSVPYVR